MDERPSQPPEGKLIAEATAARGLSIREASRRAKISYGRWRQITSGVQHVGPGVTAAVRAPAGTVARMANVVGIAPELLAAEGQRPDAAEVLREILCAGPGSPPPASSPAEALVSNEPDDEAFVFFPDDQVLRWVFRASFLPLTAAQREAVKTMAKIRAGRGEEPAGARQSETG